MYCCIRCGKPLSLRTANGKTVCENCRTDYSSVSFSFYREFGSVSFRQDCAVEWTKTPQAGFCGACGSKWESRGVFSLCPFCGKPLVNKNKEPAAGGIEATRKDVRPNSDGIESVSAPDVSGSNAITGPTEQDTDAGKSAGTIVKSGSCGANVRYTLDGDGTLTVSGKGKMTDYAWGSSPFYNDPSIKTVVIEAGITSVGSYAFFDCGQIIKVVLPDSVITIGDCAFTYCSGITEFVIPDSVTSIGKWAFRALKDLKHIWIPDNTKKIGKYAFYSCPGLTIHGEAGSEAQKYADANQIPFSAEVDPDKSRTGAADEKNEKRQIMYCIACGATLTDLEKPCPGCGRSLSPEERQFYLRSAQGNR